MQKKPVTATALAKIKAAAKTLRRDQKVSYSEALEEAARTAGFANYHQAVSGVSRDSVVKAIAAFRRCIKGGGTEDLVQVAQRRWYDVATSNDPQMIGRLESQCAADVDLAATYYHVVSSYLMGAPSYEPDNGWVKVSGFVFEVPNAHQYAPVVQLSDQQCEELAAKLKNVRTLPGGVFPGNIWVSRFGLVFPASAKDMIVDQHLLGMEASLGTSWRPQFPFMPVTPCQDALLIYVMVLMELPWRNDVDSWEDFDQNFACEVERDDVRPALRLSVPALSAQPAIFRVPPWGDAMFSLGETIYGESFRPLEDLVVNELNSVPRDQPRIDFLVAPKTDAFGLSVYSIIGRISDGEHVIEEVQMFDTISPGFAIGWMSHVLDVYVGHQAQMRTIPIVLAE